MIFKTNYNPEIRSKNVMYFLYYIKAIKFINSIKKYYSWFNAPSEKVSIPIFLFQ